MASGLACRRARPLPLPPAPPLPLSRLLPHPRPKQNRPTQHHTPLCRREDDGRFLLLQRRSKHHDRAWGLPGGNAEPADGSLLDTAEREAAEEMGGLPAGFSVLQRIDSRWAEGAEWVVDWGGGGGGGGVGQPPPPAGAARRPTPIPIQTQLHKPPQILNPTPGFRKGKDKFYAVFLCRVPGAGADAFRPTLNDESRDWRWLAPAAARKLDLHPVARDVLDGTGRASLAAALALAGADAGRGY